MKLFQTVLLILVVVGANAQAHSVPDVYVEYETFVSQEGESEQEFVLRVAPTLRDLTKATGWEVCGVLAQGEAGMGVVLTSSQATIACVLRPELVPEGMEATARSIHSHPGPNTKDVGFTDMDHHLAQASGHRLTIARGQDRGRANQRGGGFSTQDFEMGPGYLVLEREVLYQEGFGTVARVGRIK